MRQSRRRPRAAPFSRESFYSGLRATDIRVRVERAQGDDVRLLVGQYQSHTELLAFRIGDAVRRKDRLPRAAVNLVFRAANDRGRVGGAEYYLEVWAAQARRVGRHYGRRVVQLDRLGLLFVHERLRGGVRSLVRRDDFEDISPVRQRVGVNGVIVVAQAGLERIEIAAGARRVAIVDGIFDGVAVLILGLPLQRDRPALEDPAGRNLRHCAENRRIKSGLIGAAVWLRLRQGLKRDSGRQYVD